MDHMILFAICFIVGLLIGFILGRYNNKKAPNGQIILDHNEEGTERIRFVLGLQYDDFKKYSNLTFKVINSEDNKNAF